MEFYLHHKRNNSGYLVMVCVGGGLWTIASVLQFTTHTNHNAALQTLKSQRQKREEQ